MMTRRQFVPAAIRDGEYTITDGHALGAIYRVAPAGSGKAMAGMVLHDYVIVQVKTAIGWSPLKTPGCVSDVLGLIDSEIDRSTHAVADDTCESYPDLWTDEAIAHVVATVSRASVTDGNEGDDVLAQRYLNVLTAQGV